MQEVLPGDFEVQLLQVGFKVAGHPEALYHPVLVLREHFPVDDSAGAEIQHDFGDVLLYGWRRHGKVVAVEEPDIAVLLVELVEKL